MSVQFLKVTGGVIAYRIFGQGPFVLATHGIGDSSRAYRFLRTKFVDSGYTFVEMDLRGCGESSAEFSTYSRTDIAGDIVAVLEHLGATFENQAVLLGHSISGGAATIAAANAPTLISAVVEICPFTREQSMGLSAFFRPGIPSLIGAAVFGSPKLWGAYLNAAMPQSKPDDWADELAIIERKLRENGRIGAFKKMIYSPPTDAGAKLGNVHCPVLVIMGEKDPDFADPRAEADGIVGMLSSGSGKTAIIPGSGHYPHIDSPDQVMAVITPFLQEVSGSA